MLDKKIKQLLAGSIQIPIPFKHQSVTILLEIKAIRPFTAKWNALSRSDTSYPGYFSPRLVPQTWKYHLPKGAAQNAC